MVNSLPNVDEKNPAKLSEEELVVISKLKASFLNNSLLQAHVDFLFEKGGIYKVYNGNLLFHGCIPMNEDGSYTEVTIKNKEYKGRALLDKYEKILRKAHNKRYENTTNQEMDVFWYLWTGPNSSLFGKDTMRTFERIFIEDKATHVENKNPYYRQIEKEAVCKQVLEEFGLSPEKGHIINGHVPVKVNKGESPVKAGGRLIVIDGGLSKAYQNVTGIAGYTLLFNSYGMLLASHEPFTSAKDSYENNVDMISELSIVEITKDRILVADTDIGKKLADDIADLKLLLAAYRQGDIKTQAY